MKVILYRCTTALPLEQPEKFMVHTMEGTFYIVSNQLSLESEQTKLTLALLKSFAKAESVTFFIPDFIKEIFFGYDFKDWKDTELDAKPERAQHKLQALKKAIFEQAQLNESSGSIEFLEIADDIPKVVPPEVVEVDPFTLVGQINLFWSSVMVFADPVYGSTLMMTVMLTAMLAIPLKSISGYSLDDYIQQGKIAEAQEKNNTLNQLDQRRLTIAIHEVTTKDKEPPALLPTTTPPAEDKTFEYLVQNGDNPTVILKKCFGTYDLKIWRKIEADNNRPQEPQPQVKAGERLVIKNPKYPKCDNH